MALSYLFILAICVIMGVASLTLVEPVIGKRLPDEFYVIAAIVVIIVICLAVFSF